jgi:hypothetical protein
MTERHPFRSTHLLRDHARPRGLPHPSVTEFDARLQELLLPVAVNLVTRFHELGRRERVLTLPVMLALVLSAIWRQVPGVRTLAALLHQEALLWVPPLTVSPGAISQRLRSLPPVLFQQLFADLVPTFQARAQARQRPQPPAVAHALRHFARLWVVDGTTLEVLFKKVGLLRGRPDTVLGGTVLAVTDLATRQPVHLVYDADPAANEKRFLEEALQAVLPSGTLVVCDAGFCSYPWFDWLIDQGCGVLTRARTNAAFTVLQVLQVLQDSPTVRDRLVRLGFDPRSACTHPLRLVELRFRDRWYRYLTSVLDPRQLPVAEVQDLYARRWRIEEAFLQVKRLLGLSYLWTGSVAAIELQCWATWLLYATLVDLCDAVAEELGRPLDDISVEMTYRALYFFYAAVGRGEATDAVAFLAGADHRRWGIVKPPRLKRERQRRADQPPDLLPPVACACGHGP